jgi:hypothetical protein
LLEARYRGRGSDPFPPARLLAVALYEVHHGHHSPAHWHRHAGEADPVRWLLCGLRPSRTAWYDFRDRIGPGLLALAQQAVRQAVAAGLTPANRAAVDGTSLAANSTRHKMLGEASLARRLGQLRQAAAAGRPAAPAGEGPPPAAAPPPAWLAPTAPARRRQLRRYERAGAQMEQRQRRNRGKRASKRTAAGKILLSPGDPEAAVGRDKEKVFRPLYNAQLLADLDSPLVLGYDVLAQQNDAGLLGGLLRQAERGLGRAIAAVVCDSAYAGGQDLAEAAARGATVYAPWQANDYSDKKAAYYGKERFKWLAGQQAYECPAGQRLSCRGASRQRRSGPERLELRTYRAEAATCQGCEQRGKCTAAKGGRSISRSEHEEHVERLRERMETEAARALYRLRKQTVERLNAEIKQHRGLRRLSGRGRERAVAQLGLVALSHNLLALEKLRRQRGEGAEVAVPPPATG